MKHIDQEFCLPFDNTNPEFWMRIEHLGRYIYAAGYIRRNKFESVLDVACADGYGCLEMAATDAQIYGVDYNQKLINNAQASAAAEQKMNVKFHKADLNTHSLDMVTSVNLVTCFDTLEHLASPQEFLIKLCSKLKKNGMLLLSVPKAKYEPMDKDGKPTNEFHLHRFSKESLHNMLEAAGFCIQKELAQPYTNICMSLENKARRDTKISKKEVRAYFEQSREALRFFARMFGIPSSDLEKFSYSMFIVAKKV